MLGERAPRGRRDTLRTGYAARSRGRRLEGLLGAAYAKEEVVASAPGGEQARGGTARPRPLVIP